MDLSKILHLTNTINNAQADSKKSVLELISKLIAKDLLDIEYEQIFDCFIAREKLGSTGIGHGIALPHGRMKNINNPIGCLMRLKKPIEFDAIDNKPVDIFFGLIIPKQSNDHYLAILATLAEKFSNKDFREKLHQAKDDVELYRLATEN